MSAVFPDQAPYFARWMLNCAASVPLSIDLAEHFSDNMVATLRLTDGGYIDDDLAAYDVKVYHDEDWQWFLGPVDA